jgi:hypothetical protein
MRFIVMHKVDANMEAGGKPSHELIQQMGALVGESLKSKVFLDGAGLHRSARRTRLRFEGGRPTVERGPYAGGNELVAAMAMVKVPTFDDAVALASRFAAALGDVEIELGPVVEGWDLTGAPRPANAVGERVLLLIKGDADDERATPRAASRAAALDRLGDELRRDGTLLLLERLAPSARGARLRGPKGKRTWTDGPFAESKELIAGFSILSLPTRVDAIAWADRYAAILVDCEVDVREMID